MGEGGARQLEDAAQGLEAQTFTVLNMAREAGLTIIPVVNKIDLPSAQPDLVVAEVAALLAVSPSSVLKVSGKTGAGVPELLAAIVERIPPPAVSNEVKNEPRQANEFCFTQLLRKRVRRFDLAF